MSRAADLAPAILLVALALAGCATPQERRDRAAAEAAATVEAAVAEMRASMNPAELEAMERRAEADIRRDIGNLAVRCGTAARFTDAPRFADSFLILHADATSAQIACVQREIPFALPAAIGDELPDILRNCELPEARLSRAGEGYALALPSATYAGRDRAPAHGRIACITHWADERGLTLTLVEARY